MELGIESSLTIYLQPLESPCKKIYYINSKKQEIVLGEN